MAMDQQHAHGYILLRLGLIKEFRWIVISVISLMALDAKPLKNVSCAGKRVDRRWRKWGLQIERAVQ